uniref:Uncharacterized protein n=1 Tax=Eutreptiella gymnastica TaxID=73025 RepID=A0A7S4CCW9_9EUGL|mmetsp:Transcript_66650/g.111653  ORF Transcript_66650/g.111653 Transcript_66650/m.111653 type:complete len:139 (-) Transcript_66650:82-498(-)
MLQIEVLSVAHNWSSEETNPQATAISSNCEPLPHLGASFVCTCMQLQESCRFPTARVSASALAQEAPSPGDKQNARMANAQWAMDGKCMALEASHDTHRTGGWHSCDTSHTQNAMQPGPPPGTRTAHVARGASAQRRL